jgi:hypothetical protein
MVNIQAKTQALRDALINQNANQVAAALELPPIVLSQEVSSNSSTPHKHNQRPLIIGDVDYGGMLNALLDATAAVEVVSILLYDVCAVVHPSKQFITLSILLSH